MINFMANIVTVDERERNAFSEWFLAVSDVSDADQGVGQQ